jgi:hypothetical protein
MVWLLLLLAAAGLLRAVHDVGTHAPEKLAGWGPFWDARTSWRLKYKSTGEQRPAFPGSTTLFVAFTDGWHLTNLLSWACADAAVVLAAWPAYGWRALLPVLGRRVVFQPLYSYLRR